MRQGHSVRLMRRWFIYYSVTAAMLLGALPCYPGTVISEFTGPDEAFFVKSLKDEVWLGTLRGLFRWIDGQAVQVEGVRRSPRFVTEAGGEIWIGTDEGLSRWVDADVNFQLVSADSWWKNVIVNLLPGSLMDGDFLLDGEIQVHVDVSGPDADKVPKERFLFILESYAERLRGPGDFPS